MRGFIVIIPGWVGATQSVESEVFTSLIDQDQNVQIVNDASPLQNKQLPGNSSRGVVQDHPC